jgi:hypothetical protein
MVAALAALAGFMLALDLAASIWNARAVGINWRYARIAGGYYRFIAWTGAITSVAGFTIVYSVPIEILFFATHRMTVADAQILADIQMIVLGPVLLFSAYAFTFDSWRSIQVNGRGVSALVWNTGAAAWNTYTVGTGVASASHNLLDSARKTALSIAPFIIFTLSLALGILTTTLMIKHYSKHERWVLGEPSPDISAYANHGYGQW